MEERRWFTKSCLTGLALLLLLGGCARGGDDDQLFQDDFDDSSSGWGADERDEFERGYEGGEYFIELYRPSWFAWAYPDQRFDDVSIAVEVYPTPGSQGGHFGVLCRHANLKNFYYFAISADGYYAIFRRVDGGDLKVLSADGGGMTHSPAISTGAQTNAVRAVCQGDELSLYVNGELLETVTDDTHAQGDVGIGAGSGSEGDVRIQFDNFIVTTR